MRRMREDRLILGPSAHVPNLWRHAVLRQLSKSSRHETRARNRASGHCLRTTGGALVVLLS